MLAPDTELGLDLLLDCLMNPSFPADVLDAKREELLSAIAEEEKTADVRAFARICLSSLRETSIRPAVARHGGYRQEAHAARLPGLPCIAVPAE